MRALLTLFAIFFHLALNAATQIDWEEATSLIGLPTSYGNVHICYDSTNNRFFAAWTNNHPAYAICTQTNGTWSWSTTSFIDTAGPAYDVNLCYDSTNDRVFAAWKNINDNQTPYYAIYENGAWSPAATIDADEEVSANVSLCFDSVNNRVYAAWRSNYSGANPKYSYYSGNSWSSTADISSSAVDRGDIGLCFNSQTQQVIAAWNEANTNIPKYASFNGSSWTEGSISGSASVLDSVNLCVVTSTNQVFATWGGSGSPSYPMYSIGTYSNNTWSWSNPATISTEWSYTSSYYNVPLYYDDNHEIMIGTWYNSSYEPVYIVYESGSWGTAGTISSNTAGSDQLVTISGGNELVMAAWPYKSDPTDSMATATPNFSLGTVGIPEPVSALQAIQLINDFGVVKEYYNVINWSASPTNDILGYKIYRNGNLIATTDTETLTYSDHNVPKDVAFTYTVNAYNSSDQESDATEVTVD